MDANAVVSFLILLTIKASVLLLAAILCLGFLRRATASTRHVICVLTMCGVVLLPLLMLTMPSWRVGADLFRLVEISSAQGRGSSVGGAAMASRWESAVVLLWLAGMAICFLRAAAGWLLVRREQRRSLPFEDQVWQRDVALLAEQLRLNPLRVSLRRGRVNSSFACGALHPMIIVPDAAVDWDLFHRRAVLLHELAHIRRCDSLSQYVSQLACALLWFHPLVWMIAARLDREQELSCDDAVLMSGVTPASYAGILLETARELPSPFLSACGFAGKSPFTRIRARFAHVLDSRRDHGTDPKLAKCSGIVFASLLLLLGSVMPMYAQKVYKIGGDVSAPKLLAHSEPSYTDDAKNKGIQGTVLLSVIVGADGRVGDAHVERSLEPGLDGNAVHTVEEWRFEPGRRKGSPVDVRANIEVNFRLK